ncbi:ABC transporter substrate-binding protein [Trueperella sp. LYQ143]|uniref:ABC transporter substrate-binding protein n=1 Tax=unclassified Trueperella TaxID=2630174 RepID=UPI003982FD74
MRRKRLFASLATIAAAIASLSACGGSDSPEPNSAPDGELEGNIVFWSSYTQGPRAQYMQEMADRFMKEHPKVHIDIELFSWGEFYTKWTTGLATGNVPDISSALPYHVTEMIDAEALVPLNDVIDEIGRDRFYEAALKEGEKDGQNYSIPLYSHAQVMWYHDEMLKAAGVEVPQTWDELAVAAKKLTGNGQYGLSVPMGTNDMMATRFLNYYVKSNGGTFFDDKGHAKLTDPIVLDGIKYWVDMYKNASPEGSVNFAVLDQATLYYQGKTAFDFNSGFQISGVASTSPQLLDGVHAAPLPKMKASDPMYGAETSNQPMVIWANSKHPEIAKAFLKTLYQTDDYIRFLHSVPVGMMPALKDIADNEAFLNDPQIQKFRKEFDLINQTIPLSTAIGLENGPRVQAGILANQGVIESMFQDIVLHGTPIETAAKTAEDKLNQLFEAAGATE